MNCAGTGSAERMEAAHAAVRALRSASWNGTLQTRARSPRCLGVSPRCGLTLLRAAAARRAVAELAEAKAARIAGDRLLHQMVHLIANVGANSSRLNAAQHHLPVWLSDALEDIREVVSVALAQIQVVVPAFDGTGRERIFPVLLSRFYRWLPRRWAIERILPIQAKGCTIKTRDQTTSVSHDPEDRLRHDAPTSPGMLA